MNRILQGWKMVLHDYRWWKDIISRPYCNVDCVFFFGNLGQPQISLDDYIKEVKRADAVWQYFGLNEEYEKVLYDNLWELYDDIEERMNETDKLLEEVDTAEDTSQTDH